MRLTLKRVRTAPEGQKIDKKFQNFLESLKRRRSQRKKPLLDCLAAAYILLVFPETDSAKTRTYRGRPHNSHAQQPQQ